MPWRRTRDPYAIWISEVMLQQTQVATVLPFYERWMSRFPSFEALAEASEQEALSLWQGLGYYRRCRMLLSGARYVRAHGVPGSAAEWLKVPGVGKYTSAAIASICFDEVSAVVDGNVERVFARFAGCEESGARLNQAAWRWAPQQIDPSGPGDWNQALMELGATVCRPREPRCSSCPISVDCFAFANGRQLELPRAAPKAESVLVEHHAFVHRRGDRFGLEQIPAGEWGEGLWRFPTKGRGIRIGEVKHAVTRHKVRLQVHLPGPAEGIQVAETHTPYGLSWYTRSELETLPMPAPQRRVLQMALSHSGE